MTKWLGTQLCSQRFIWAATYGAATLVQNARSPNSKGVRNYQCSGTTKFHFNFQGHLTVQDLSLYCLSEVCWCGETQKSKQSAIDEGTAKIQELAAEIEQGIALSSRLGPEIDSLKSEFEKNAAALKQAAAIREKQSTEFEEQSKDLAESISAVKKALKVMSKKETKESKESVSFLQTSKSSEVSSALREVFVRSRRPVAGSASRNLGDLWRSGRGCIVQV